MHIAGTEPSSVIVNQKMRLIKMESDVRKVPNKLKSKTMVS